MSLSYLKKAGSRIVAQHPDWDPVTKRVVPDWDKEKYEPNAQAPTYRSLDNELFVGSRTHFQFPVHDVRKDPTPHQAPLQGSTLDEFLNRMTSNETTLTELDLAGESIQDENAKRLARVLKLNTTLKYLYLQWNSIQDEGASAIALVMKKNKTLTKLDLGRNNVSDPTLAVFEQSLKVNVTLKTLNLSVNRIGPAGAASLAETLKANEFLTELELNQNFVLDEGAEALGKALQKNNGLVSFSLSKNDLSDAGGEALAKGLEKNVGLETLTLRENRNWKRHIGDPTAIALGNTLKARYTALTRLDLAGNKIADAGLAGIAAGLVKNRTLKQLCLKDNQIGAEGARALAEALGAPWGGRQGNTTLLYIDVGHNRVGDAGAAALGNCLVHQWEVRQTFKEYTVMPATKGKDDEDGGGDWGGGGAVAAGAGAQAAGAEAKAEAKESAVDGREAKGATEATGDAKDPQRERDGAGGMAGGGDFFEVEPEPEPEFFPQRTVSLGFFRQKEDADACFREACEAAAAECKADPRRAMHPDPLLSGARLVGNPALKYGHAAVLPCCRAAHAAVLPRCHAVTRPSCTRDVNLPCHDRADAVPT
jgi:Ran GTPase-activating protein (RanGAP) involved in mRNA processing and transport